MSEKIQLDKLVEPNTLIETKHISGNDWVVSMVLNIHEEFIEIMQVEEYLTLVLMIGDKLECRIVKKDRIYIIDTEVYNIKFASRSVVLRVNEIKWINNNRKHKRYDVYLSASFSREGKIGENYCIVINVSLGGLSIITRSVLETGDAVDLSMYFKGFNFISADCSVKWINQINGNYLYGLSIDYMDEKTRIVYRKYIRKLQSKERLLRKKWAE